MLTLKSVRLAVAGVATLGTAAGAQIVPIPGLFNTGVDGAGAKMIVGSTDLHYTVLETGTQAIVTNHGAYAQVATAGYIWQTASGQPGSTTRTFRTTFDLTGLDPTTASLGGSWSTDNFGSNILINGVSTGNTSGGFGSFTAFTVNSGFVAGLNTLDFVVQDFGAPGALAVNGLAGRASIQAASTVPEPATVALVAGGLLALAATSLRRRNG